MLVTLVLFAERPRVFLLIAVSDEVQIPGNDTMISHHCAAMFSQYILKAERNFQLYWRSHVVQSHCD